ncbi:hypothetical protein [Sinimarinibacterium flocculans]|uniref:hypothetical protein n=1 Tax=Sinimarinibacterium flocculans TaxID=985250 RepID=UPI003515D5B8
MTVRLNHSETSYPIQFDNICARRAAPTRSPIDEFYIAFDKAIKKSSQPPFESDSASLQLLLVPLFGAAELYFRRFISVAVAICPLCREQASTQQINYGAVAAFGIDGLAVAFGEHEGFTTDGAIRRRTLNILGIEIKQNTSAYIALEEFETVCHLRHALVHLSGELLYLNRRKLKIARPGRLVLQLDAAAYQAIAGKVCNAVRAYNSYVGNELLKRWQDQGYIAGQWRRDSHKVRQLLNMTLSKHDLGACDPREMYDAFLAAAPRRSRGNP